MIDWIHEQDSLIIRVAWLMVWVGSFGLELPRIIQCFVSSWQNALMMGNFVLEWKGKSKHSPLWVREAPCACVMKLALLGPFKIDCWWSCCGKINQDGHEGTYSVCSMQSSKSSLCWWGMWKVTVPIPLTAQLPPNPFKGYGLVWLNFVYKVFEV